MNINKLRIHYFFTEEANIKSLIRDTKISIKITTGQNWNSNTIASSNVYALKGLNEILTKSAQKNELIAALFSDNTDQVFAYLRVFFPINFSSWLV